MFFIEVEKQIAASPEQVFELLTDHANYAENFRVVTKSELLSEGHEEKNGLGAKRNIESGRFKVVEEIVVFEKPNRFGYKIVASKPFKMDHQLGDIRLTANGNGQTLVKWQSKGRVTTPLIGRWLDKQMTKNGHKALKAILNDISSKLI